MSALTAAVRADAPLLAELLEACAASPAVSEILLLDPGGTARVPATGAAARKTRRVAADLQDGAGLARVLAETRTDHLLLVLPGGAVRFGQRALERLLAVAEDSGAGWVYADFRDEVEGRATDHPLLDHQPGSLRDTFDCGSLVVVATAAARRVVGTAEELRWGALYDLRLKLSQAAPMARVPEPLYARTPADLRPSGERGFDYVDPRQREYQLEMEAVATAHLKRIGAWLAPTFRPRPPSPGGFPVQASVVIPVRNRERTVADAVRSALGQRAGFAFNVIVVDNHSTDGTTGILADLAREDRRLVHLVPARTDLGIGGCWNEAVFSAHCGEYAVQLDSDDLYAGEGALQQVVDQLCGGPYAMVIGSYRIVSFDLQEIPPGLIDHREWTRENGRNNALRINGLGAPRAFFVPVLRQTGLPNVSYGEDYATALRISREYEIGRSYEPVYLARRWEGNSDAALPLLTANRYDAYKDHLRTVEILARQTLVRAL
jgi:glycosyl transferase family 2